MTLMKTTRCWYVLLHSAINVFVFYYSDSVLHLAVDQAYFDESSGDL